MLRLTAQHLQLVEGEGPETQEPVGGAPRVSQRVQLQPPEPLRGYLFKNYD